MAYNLIYYNDFVSLQFNAPVRIEILKKDHSSNSFTKELIGATLKLGNAGDERYEPIKKTTCELSLVSKTDQQFSQFFTSNDKEFMVKLYRRGVIIWSGFIEADSYGEPYSFDKNYNIGVTARDNLGTLEDLKYLDENKDRYTGLEKASVIIARCLSKTGLDLVLDDQINIFSDTMSESLTTTEQEYINQTGFVNDKGETYSCFEVLESILLGHGAQIRQSNGKWVIREIGTYYNTPQETKGIGSQSLLVNTSGDVLLVNDLDYLDISGDGYRWLNSDSELVFKEAWKQFTIEQDFKATDSFLDFIRDYSTKFTKYNWAGDIDNYDKNWIRIDDVTYTDDQQFSINPDYSDAFRVYAPQDTWMMLMSTDMKISSIEESFRLLTSTYAAYNGFDSDGEFFGLGLNTGQDFKLRLLIRINDGVNYYKLTDTGWILSDNSLTDETVFDIEPYTLKENNVIFDSIPIDGTLEIYFKMDDYAITSSPSDVFSSRCLIVDTFKLETLQTDAFGDTVSISTGQSITSSVDIDNNLTPDEFEIEIGEIPNTPNTSKSYFGGLFDSSSNALINWHRKNHPSSIYPLLEVVARGYNTQYKQSAWQVSGSILWDFDLFTSLNEDGHVLLVNDLSWDLNNDEASGEFIEVFEYDNSIDIIEESQITDGSTRDFFQVNDNVDFLAFTIDAGAPKRISSLADETNATDSYIILDDPSKTESKRFSWGAFITALENTLNSFLRKGQNLADLDDVSTAQTNLDVYGKSASDTRYVNIDGNETINDTKTFSELISLVKGWFIGIFTSGFAGQGARLNLNGGKTELEVDRLKVREVFTAYETQIGQIRGIDGDLIVSSSEKAETVIEEELNILVEDGVELLVDDLINLEI